jgi:hypothetical protein
VKKQGLQELVKSIFSSETIRSHFASDPVSVISNYHLTPAEKKAVLSPRMRLALSTGDKGTLVEFGVLNTWF